MNTVALISTLIAPIAVFVSSIYIARNHVTGSKLNPPTTLTWIRVVTVATSLIYLASYVFDSGPFWGALAHSPFRHQLLVVPLAISFGWQACLIHRYKTQHPLG